MLTNLKRLGGRDQREKEDTIDSRYLHHCGFSVSGNTTGNRTTGQLGN